MSGDPALFALHEELAALPGAQPGLAASLEVSEIAVPLLLTADGNELAFISTATSFGTAIEVTVSELAIESFFPADEATAASCGHGAKGRERRPRDDRPSHRVRRGRARDAAGGACRARNQRGRS